MRPIKFRVYDTVKKEWIHDTSHAVNLFGETVIMGELLRRPDDSTVSLDELKNLVAMQYTGLNDKNGKEIWENDIIEYQNDADSENDFPMVRDVVEFMHGAFCINGHMFMAIVDLVGECEVVGNIHEHPHLLV